MIFKIHFYTLMALSTHDGGRRMKFLCIIVLLECVRQCVPMGPEPAQEILWIGFLLHTHLNITLTEHCYCNYIILSTWRLHSTVNWINCIDTVHKKIRLYSTTTVHLTGIFVGLPGLFLVKPTGNSKVWLCIWIVYYLSSVIRNLYVLVNCILFT